jgi:hypothetical protein
MRPLRKTSMIQNLNEKSDGLRITELKEHVEESVKRKEDIEKGPSRVLQCAIPKESEFQQKGNRQRWTTESRIEIGIVRLMQQN